MKKKIVYIAHPIKGDVDLNIAKIAAIVQKINLGNQPVIPFAPYLHNGLNDNIPAERERGIENNIEIISRGMIDEMWFYGPRLSEGMRQELALCFKHNITPVPMDERLADEMREAVNKHYEHRLSNSQSYTIIFTKQDNTTEEQEVFASHDVHAAKLANALVALHEFKSWQFADQSISHLGTL